MATNTSAGTMVASAFKSLFIATLRFLILLIAWCMDLAAKILSKISELIRNNIK